MVAYESRGNVIRVLLIAASVVVRRVEPNEGDPDFLFHFCEAKEKKEEMKGKGISQTLKKEKRRK